MTHSAEAIDVLRGFFHDTYRAKNLNGNPLLRDGEEIDVGQAAQRDANVQMIAHRMYEAGVHMIKTDYTPISHEQWEPGEVIVNVRTGSSALVGQRKVGPDAEPFPGWWVWSFDGHPGGGVADFAKDWRSVKCLLAERQYIGL